MRLAPYAEEFANPAAGNRTLDEILASNAERAPGAPALYAPGLAQTSWREVDRAVSALAEAFAGWQLGEDAVVGLQLGSTPQAAIACLALWRAGLVPAMLPLAFRRRETLAALSSVHATAIVAHSRGGGANLAEIGCEVAAGLETIRYVGCFGRPTPDGATPLDEALARPAVRYVRPDRPEDAADHVAIVTFDAGGAPVARSHNDLAAAGLGPILTARLSERSSLVSTLDLAGLGGLSTGLVPWLLTRCLTTFHTAWTGEALARAVLDAEATHLVLPGRIANDVFPGSGLPEEQNLAALAVWRAPDGRGDAEDVRGASAVVDVSLFGELGVRAARRGDRTRHPPLPLGASSPVDGVTPLIDVKVSDSGRLSLRGPACPQAPCPAAPHAPTLSFDPEGYVETSITAVADHAAKRVSLGKRRRGVAQVGGVSLSLADMEQAWKRSGVRGRPTVIEDRLFGARLALSDDAQDDPRAAADALEAAGFGPAALPHRRAEPPAAPALRSA